MSGGDRAAERLRYHDAMNANRLWQDAAAFAARAHRHQYRNDGQTPNFSHPARVALCLDLSAMLE